MCCDFENGWCGHMAKKCTFKSEEYAHLPEMTRREFCGCSRCHPIYSRMVEEHNERAERLRYNNGKYMQPWEILGE